jgi:hypothetical protein
MTVAGRVRATVGLAAVALVPLLGACSNVTDTLLEATDPDVISPENAQSAEGALALYNGALSRLKVITAGNSSVYGEGSTWLFGGLLADEWSTSSTFVQNDETDQRSIQINNSTITNMFRYLARARQSSTEAIRGIRKFRETETTRVAEMYFVRAFAEMQMANDFCNGIPLSSQDENGVIVYGTPKPVAEVFQASIADADSGLAEIKGTAAGDIAVKNALLITKARALLGLGKYADAAAAVAGIPTTYSYDATYTLTTGDNVLWSQPASSRRYTVGDSLEGRGHNLLVKNAIPFFSAKDTRLPVSYKVGTKNDTTLSQDGSIPSRTTTLWGRGTSVSVVNGLDARLIEAEAKLNANDIAGMVTILNDLRKAPPKIGEVQPDATKLPPLAAPATKDAAVSLLFREKAFWTFSRGQRLGDMRRLVRQYGRSIDQVFPIGEHYRGGNYGPDVNLPVPQQEQNNPELGGAPACIDRNA